MTDYLRLAVVFLLAVNPAFVFLSYLPPANGSSPRARVTAAALGLALATGLYAAAVLGSSPLLDFLKVEPETFRVAAGVVLATMGARALLPASSALGDVPSGWRAGIYPLAIPLLAGPAGLVAALSYAADESAGLTFVATLPALGAAAALSAWAPSCWRPACAMAAPLAAALLVAAGAGLIVTGVRDI